MKEFSVFGLIIHICNIILNLYGLCLNLFHKGDYLLFFGHLGMIVFCAFMISEMFKSKNDISKTN